MRLGPIWTPGCAVNAESIFHVIVTLNLLLIGTRVDCLSALSL